MATDKTSFTQLDAVFRTADIIKKHAADFEALWKLEFGQVLAKATMLEDGHLEPGTHEGAMPGAAEHMEPGDHEQLALDPAQDPKVQDPVGSGDGLPGGQLGAQGGSQMDNCPMCGQLDQPGSCTCLSGLQKDAPTSMAQGGMSDASIAGGMAKSELMKKAPPGFSEKTMRKLKEKHGTESAFKIAWAAHGKAVKKSGITFQSGQGAVDQPGQMGETATPAGQVPMTTGGMDSSAMALSEQDPSKKTTAKPTDRNPPFPANPKAALPDDKKPKVDPSGKGGGSVDKPKANDPLKGKKKDAIGVKKDEVPTAKPPSGKVPGLGAAPKASNTSKPAIGAKPPMAKAALAPGAVKMAQQHGIIAGSKAAMAGGAPSAPAAAPSRPLTHPSDMSRATAMHSAMQGAFQPSGPVSSGLELAHPPRPGGMRFGKGEVCALCGKGEHPGKCEGRA